MYILVLSFIIETDFNIYILQIEYIILKNENIFFRKK